MISELKGTVTSIIYEGTDGYVVAEVEADEPTIVVGNMPDLKPGELACFFGELKKHHRYGEQLVVTSYETTLPKDLNDIVLFLGGGFIKGLGEVLARRVVEEFGANVFNVIENDHKELSKVKGVSKKLADSIHAAFLEYSNRKYVYADLMGMGLTMRQANACVAELGDDAAQQVKNNPYILIDFVRGVDFLTADKIALKIGVEQGSPFRIKNGILNVLKKMILRGSTFVYRKQLVPHVAKNLRVSNEQVNTCLLALAFEEEIVLKKYYPDIEAVYLKAAYKAEFNCAAKLFALSKTSADTRIKNIDKLLKKQTEDYSLTDEQEQAVFSAVTNRVSVITGGPGTGKTTILKAIINILGGAGIEVCLAAPTGRAAKRMNETTGVLAATIHRLLEYSYDEDAYNCYFRRNADNPLSADVVIVDEVSMLDVFLFSNLLNALKDGASLVLVGDADQLPSVSAGNVMGDVLQSEIIKSVKLTHKFRNADGIADAAYDILQGKNPDTQDTSFEFVECESESEVRELVCQKYMEYHDVQVIAPIKRGELGTVALNSAIRERANAKHQNKAEIIFGDRIFREGDRVMQIKNNYARQWRDLKGLQNGEGVFNGDIGSIVSIRAGVTEVLFEDMKQCSYEIIDLAELDGAYAYTIHKSQGSEFDVIIIPMYYETNPFFARNLLYTALTRAKKKVIIAGNRKTFSYMIANENHGVRATGLCRELRYMGRLLG
ncbi:MAG: ATP-dependent RecD-like DNA helicase [Christensenellaceae bacterium]